MPFDAITTSAPAAAARPLQLNVRMPDGGWLAPPAEAGVSVTELLSRFGLPMRRECHGRCSCSTCKALISPAWRDRVSARAAGAERLSGLPDRGNGMQLLCGLVMTHCEQDTLPRTADVVVFCLPEQAIAVGEHVLTALLDRVLEARVLAHLAIAPVAVPTCSLPFAERERFPPELVTALEDVLDRAGLRDDDIVIRAGFPADVNLAQHEAGQ